jgi:fluoroquinolone transport system permease protein
MRFLNTLINDIHFQITYGFYFLYAFFSVIYIAVLWIVPPDYKPLAASLIILTDPAMLGIFFIGGIWLLEKGEGLHSFWSISPLRTMEYIMAKSVSLGFLSAVSAVLIALLSMRCTTHPLLLLSSVFLGAVVFNFIGLMAASYARSVNQYMIIAALPAVVLSIPPVLTAFGITHPLLEIFPGTALWHMISVSMGISQNNTSRTWMVLIFWFGILLFFANRTIGTALQSEGRENS